MATLRALRARLREGGPVFDGLDAAVHLHDNRLTRLVIGGAMTASLEALSEQGGLLEPLISSFHCTDNVVDGAIS